MDDEEAAAVLRRLEKKYPLTAREREALESATGILSWAALYEDAERRREERRRAGKVS